MSLYDFAARDPDGETHAVVEVKRQLGTSAAWACEVRRYMLGDRSAPRALFLLVTPDRIYVWSPDSRKDAAPDHVVDAAPYFAPYFERVGASASTIGSQAFAALVSWWLDRVADGTVPESDETLVRAGLIEALVGTRVFREAAA